MQKVGSSMAMVVRSTGGGCCKTAGLPQTKSPLYPQRQTSTNISQHSRITAATKWNLLFDSRVLFFLLKIMSGILSYVPLANKVVGADGNAKSIQLPCVKVHNVETDPEPRARCLKHLLKANHVNYSVLYNGNRFDNHNPHILSSAYIMGASVPQLNDIYEEQVKELDPWIPAPAEIVDNDWGDFLGNRPYQRAYLDFFEDKLAMDHAYNWKSVVEHYLFANKAVLFHSLTCGCKLLAHGSHVLLGLY